MAGLKLVDATKGRTRRDRRPECEYLIKRDRVDLCREVRNLEKRLDLGCEIERAALQSMEERAHPHAVAREHHPVPACIPDRKGEVAVQEGETFFAHLFIKMEDDLRVARRAETAAPCAQLVTQFNIIEDLTIEGDRQLATRIGHRLLAVAKANDGQPDMAEARARGRKDSMLVRPAMANRGRHLFEKGLTVPY